MKTDMFDFFIPENLIAQFPVKNRSDSRMLVYFRDKDVIIDSYTKNITDFLDTRHFLVFNNSRVIPARMKIKKKENNVNGEILVLKIIDENTLEIITDRSKKYKSGTALILPDGSISHIKKDTDDIVKILFSENKIFTIEYFEKYGHVPLPPYIKKGEADDEDKSRYQTIYKKDYGSSAAPTAGLHFDDSLFLSLKKSNIDHAFLSLHVGLGTFQPIYAENIEDHKIHTEEYFIGTNDADKINDAIKNDKIIIPVGTTSLRTLETAFDNGFVKDGSGKSDIYIYPPYQFKIAKGLFTNFHTPRSSLAVLVSSMIGIDKISEIYKYAVKKEYRFFSYGDSMLIL
jgi:S-adenosylmethionine:tRNA ribosyltransferase-isomerase